MGLLVIIGILVAAVGGIFGFAIALSLGAAPGGSTLQSAVVLEALYLSPAICVLSGLNALSRIRNGDGWKAPLAAHFVWSVLVAPVAALPLFLAASLLGRLVGIATFEGDAGMVMVVIPGVMLALSLALFAVSIVIAIRTENAASSAPKSQPPFQDLD